MGGEVGKSTESGAGRCNVGGSSSWFVIIFC